MKSEKRYTSWVLVLVLLLGLPLLSSLALRFWLGVPQENHQAEQISGQLGLESLELAEQDSLHFGHLFFARFRMKPEAVGSLHSQLEGWQTRLGLPEQPITLDLERSWWDPDATQSGTTWIKDEVQIWSPFQQNDLFYAVASVEKAGKESVGTKSSK